MLQYGFTDLFKASIFAWSKRTPCAKDVFSKN